MKKISLGGLMLGVVLGVVAGSLSGSWLFWLGVGLAIGVVVGSIQTRRSLLHNARRRQELRS
jgi:F0F1-type ATP synthase assembly protein I